MSKFLKNLAAVLASGRVDTTAPTSRRHELSTEVYRQASQGQVVHVLLPPAEQQPETPKQAPVSKGTPISPEDIYIELGKCVTGFRPGNLNEIRELQKRHASNWQDRNVNFTRPEADKQWKRLNDECWRKIYQDGADPKNICVPDIESVRADYEARRELAGRVLQSLGEEALRLCVPIRTEFLVAANDHLQMLESAELAEASIFSESYTPGPRVKWLRILINHLQTAERLNRFDSPARLLPFIRF
jgi:hypothetical protein